MGKFFGYLITISLVFLQFGCGIEDHLLKSRRRTSAPKSSVDVGFVVTVSSQMELTRFLGEHPTARYRHLNSKHSWIEIFGVTHMDVVKQFGEAVIGKNDWFIATPRPMASANKDPFKDCIEDKETPKAQIDFKDNTYNADRPLMRGLTLKLSAQKSSAHPSHQGELDFFWQIQMPEGARVTNRVAQGVETEILLTDLGIYSIGLIAKDQRSVCSVEYIEVVVSDNPKFVGTDPKFKPTRLPPLHHLEELQAHRAWEISTGLGVKIAVIDSGVNYNHPSLSQNILVNHKEIPDNGIDDDNNGFVDDYLGYDFINQDAYPFDDLGHGSHVAGLAASSDFGLAKNAKILAVKAVGPLGSGDMASVAAAILYAVDRGAQIINLSLGSYKAPSAVLLKAIDFSESRGVLLVAASGNGHPTTLRGINIDQIPSFPAAFPHNNIVSVGASSSQAALASYSNFGPQSVDLVAPGGQKPMDLIFSASLENSSRRLYKGMNGTSMAAPLVSGLAAQILQLRPGLSAEKIREILMASGKPIEELKRLVVSGRKIDPLAALKLAQEDFSPF